MRKALVVFALATCFASAVQAQDYGFQSMTKLMGQSRTEYFAAGTPQYQVAVCKAGNFKTAFDSHRHLDSAKELCRGILEVSEGKSDSYKDNDGGVFNEYTFYKNKLVRWTFHVIGGREDFDFQNGRIVAVYGAPKLQETVPFQNTFGATFTGRRNSWAGKTLLITIEEIPGEDGYILTSITTREYLKTLLPEPPPKNPVAVP